MKDDIRKETCLIIKKDGKYLVGVIFGSTDLRWSDYAHEAWRTRNREDALKVAKKVGGVIMLFNPVVRKVRLAEVRQPEYVKFLKELKPSDKKKMLEGNWDKWNTVDS